LRRLLLASVVALALIADACGGGDNPTIKVSAAASLKTAFEQSADSFDAADVSFSFAGSDELAAQIRQGLKPDVYAAANAKLPNDLYKEGLVEKPVPVASNRILIAVPRGSNKVESLADLTKPGLTIAAGAATVPVGSYTREALRRMPADQARAIERNIRSNEPDVAGIVGKLSQGAVDAGFVYVTDVRAAGGKLVGIALPERFQPVVTYAAAVVKDAPNVSEAREFLEWLRTGGGHEALLDAGFGNPPI
jgi:molybdate transport system substrate-binding protein